MSSIFQCFSFLIIFLIWLSQVLVAARRIFDLCCGVQSFQCSIQTLSCSMWDLVPQPRIEPGPLALGVQSLSQQTTREVPNLLYLLRHKSELRLHLL